MEINVDDLKKLTKEQILKEVDHFIKENKVELQNQYELGNRLGYADAFVQAAENIIEFYTHLSHAEHDEVKNSESGQGLSSAAENALGYNRGISFAKAGAMDLMHKFKTNADVSIGYVSDL